MTCLMSTSALNSASPSAQDNKSAREELGS